MTSYLRYLISKKKTNTGFTALFSLGLQSYKKTCTFSDTVPIWTTFPDDRELEFCLQECVNGQCDTDAVTGITECRCSKGYYLLNRVCTGKYLNGIANISHIWYHGIHLLTFSRRLTSFRKKLNLWCIYKAKSGKKLRVKWYQTWNSCQSLYKYSRSASNYFGT